MGVEAGAASRLGEFLTGLEAEAIALRLADGDTLTAALKSMSPGRRTTARSLIENVGGTDSSLISLLHAVAGARSAPTTVDPLWTMPGHLAQGGALTSSVSHVVHNARQSITCSTFNFQRSSGLWIALRQAAQRPELTVRVYIDTEAADRHSASWTPRTTEVAEQLRPGTVLRTKHFDGAPVRNHAKFLAIDHRFLLITSANFSWSAEHGNVEFGVLIDNRNLTEAVERELLRSEDTLYERVSGRRR